MTEETIFSSADQAQETKSQEVPVVQEQAPATPATPSIPPELVEFVGEGKKYRSLDEVYKAFPNAQKHISTLEEENKAIKEELAKRRAAEELLEDIRKGVAQPAPTSPGVEVNKDVVSEIVRKELAQAQMLSTQKANTEAVVNSFKATYADKAEEMYNKLASESGLSVAELNAMVAKSPKAVLKLAGLTDKQSTKSAPLQSSVNTQAFSGNGQNQSNPVKVGKYPTSAELARAWSATREAVYKKHNIEG